jgi:transcription elongation factor Elf1
MARIVNEFSCPSCGHPGPHPVIWHDESHVAVACGSCSHDFTITQGGA